MNKLAKAPEFPELVFDERPHIYYLNGEKIPSVSNIMEPLTRAKYDGISEKTLERAADRGTAIHNAIELWLDLGIVDIPQEFRGYLDGFIGWWSLNSPELVGTEIRVYHKELRYAGTCDMLCYIGNELVLVDYKSTSSVKGNTFGVQLEAYANAFGSHGIEIESKKILHLKKTGKFSEIGFPKKDLERLQVFRACKTIYDYNRRA